jgi:sRNA-binding regulator protein Hfq
MAPSLSSPGRNDNPGHRRRQAPGDTTHKESEYIEWLSRNRVPVVVKLEDNEELRGWIEYYDRDIIRLTRDDDTNLFIYKDRMKYFYEDPAHSQRRR